MLEPENFRNQMKIRLLSCSFNLESFTSGFGVVAHDRLTDFTDFL